MLLYRSIRILLNLIEILIVVRIVFSYLNIRGDNMIIRLTYELTEPVLGPAKNLMAKLNINTGMFDFSPLVAILFLRIIDNIAARILL